MKYGDQLLGWKAWYVGKVMYSSRGTLLKIHSDFLALPSDGILCVVEFYDNNDGGIGRRIIDSGDWYYWDPKEQCIEYVPTGEWGTWKLEPRVDGCLSCVKKSGAVKDADWDQLRTTIWRDKVL